MRWKWNIAFNNDDGKKLYINYLHKKINKKFNYYPPLTPAFSCSSLLSENRNKINVLPVNTLHGSVRGSELTNITWFSTRFRTDKIALQYVGY